MGPESCSPALTDGSDEPQDPGFQPGSLWSHWLTMAWDVLALLPALLPADFPPPPGPLFPAQRPFLLVPREWGGEGPTGQEGGHTAQPDLHGLLEQHVSVSEQGCTHGT